MSIVNLQLKLMVWNIPIIAKTNDSDPDHTIGPIYTRVVPKPSPRLSLAVTYPQMAQLPALQPKAGRDTHGCTIWQGVLEWNEKTHKDSQKITRNVCCQMTITSKDDEPKLKSDLWPLKMSMKLMQKQLLDNIWEAYLKNCQSVLVHPKPCKDLELFTKAMTSGFVGYIKFPTSPYTETALVLVYIAEKRIYLGIFPRNQAAFDAHVQKISQRKKTSQSITCQVQEKMTDQELEVLGTAILQFLECPICHLIPQRSSAIQCVVGHVVCSPCSQKLNSCPLCRRKFILNPPRVFCKVLDTLPLCKHLGCSRLIKKGDQHEAFCGFRLCECQWCPKATQPGGPSQQNISQSVLGHDLLGHTREYHAGQLITDSETSDFKLETYNVDVVKNNALRKSVTKFINNNLYQVEYKSNDALSVLDISCHLVANGSEPASKTFYGAVEVSADEGTRISFLRVFQGNSLTINLDKTTMNEFVGKNNVIFKTIFETKTEAKLVPPGKTDHSSLKEDVSTWTHLEEEKLGNADLKTFVTTILKCVRCLSCDTIPRVGNIVQCVKGHVFCRLCRSSLSCTICTSEFTNQTPLIFSQLLDLLPKFCVNNDCYQLVREGDDHDFWCCFRPVECLWCLGNSPFKCHEMLSHLQEQHSTELITVNESIDFILPDFKEIIEVDKKLAKYVFGDLYFLQYSYFEGCLHANFKFIPNGIPENQSIYGLIEVSDEHGNCYSLCKEFSLNVKDFNLAPLHVVMRVQQDILKQLATKNITFKTSIVKGMNNNVHKRKQSIGCVDSNSSSQDDSKKLKFKRF